MAENDNMTEVETLFLTMEDDTEQEFAILDEFDCDGSSYVVLCRIVDDALEDEEIFYRAEYDADGELTVEYIEDDGEFEAVAECYRKLCEEAQ